MKIEYSFERHHGEINLSGAEEGCFTDGEIITIFRGIDPELKSVQIFNASRNGNALLVHGSGGWTVWRGSGPNPGRRMQLFSKPRLVGG